MIPSRDNLLRYAADPAAFRESLVIDSTPPRPLGEAMEPWQRADFAALDPAWRQLAGQSSASPIRRAYLERPRGHSKTADLAVMATWALAFSRRRLCGVAAAADADQAALLRMAVDRLLDHNEWLRELLEVQRYAVVNRQTKSELEIITADVASSYGHLPDFIICDELTHWLRPELWHSLFSSSAKRPDCVLVIITNAGVGMGTSWQWQVLEAAREGDGWYFHSLDGPQARWITESSLAEQRRFLPAKAYNRLWRNQWQTETGDALDAADIEACITLPTPPPHVLHESEPHILGLDLGLKNDHAATVLLGLDVRHQQVLLAGCQSWAPKEGGQVRLSDVRRACVEISRWYNLLAVVYDPWQAALMAEELGDAGIRMFEWPFVHKNLDRMARDLLSAFHNRRIALYRDERLIRDLCRISIVERQQGYKLHAVRDEHGHCDRATALAIALPSALDALAAVSRRPVNTEEYLLT